MTAEEERDLKFYLENTGQINAYMPFEEWYQRRYAGPDGEAYYKEQLHLAQVLVRGYRQGWAAFQEHLERAWKAKPDIPEVPYDPTIRD